MRSALPGPGALAHRMALQKPDEQSDRRGHLSVAWQPVAMVWTDLKPLSTRAFLEADQRQEETTHTITLRFRPDIASGWRFVMGARIFTIERVVDPREDRRFLTCHAIEAGR